MDVETQWYEAEEGLPGSEMSTSMNIVLSPR